MGTGLAVLDRWDFHPDRLLGEKLPRNDRVLPAADPRRAVQRSNSVTKVRSSHVSYSMSDQPHWTTSKCQVDGWFSVHSASAAAAGSRPGLSAPAPASWSTTARDTSCSFASISAHSELLGVGALKEIDRGHAELKSMHTAQVARGRGFGRAMLDHLVDTARARGYGRLSLETGSMAAFAPARALYASAGFEVWAPFGKYVLSPHSLCMTLDLKPRAPVRSDQQPPASQP